MIKAVIAHTPREPYHLEVLTLCSGFLSENTQKGETHNLTFRILQTIVLLFSSVLKCSFDHHQ